MKPSIRNLWLALWLVGIASVVVRANDLPTATPGEVGLSPDRLARLDALVERYIADKTLAGGVALIARRGKVVHLRAYGMADMEANKRMQSDTIFRIASMTKPITSVAVMMLYEEGHSLLSDLLHEFIPEFKDVTVLPPESQPDKRNVPAKRPITIRHLLTHTSGLTYHRNPRLGKSYKDAGITGGLLQDQSTLEEKMKVLARVPLLHHPGERFEYGLSIDVLGRLVEVVSSMTLDEFFQRRIFQPLGMSDTHFYLPGGKVSRLAAVYSREPGKPIDRVGEDPLQGDEGVVYSTSYPYKGPKRYYSGGGGLVSTAGDYFRFCQMMLNGGEFNGVRLLSPKTVELITTDHIRDTPGFAAPAGFGLGFRVVRDAGDLVEIGSVGSLAWGGFWYTTFFIDPREEFIGIFMVQLYPTGGLDLKGKFRILAYQSIVE